MEQAARVPDETGDLELAAGAPGFHAPVGRDVRARPEEKPG